MNKKIKVCTDPKHFAYATWSILSNNPINKIYYLLFCLFDFIILFYYVSTLSQRLHISNFEKYNVGPIAQNLNNMTGQNDYKLQLVVLKEFNEYLTTISLKNTYYFVIISSIVLGLSLVFLISILLMAVFIKNHEGLEKQSIVKKIFCLFLVSILSFLHMPIFDLLVRTLISVMNCEDLNLVVSGYCLTSFAIIFFIILMLYLVRMFNVCVPTESIPWCAPVSKICFLNLIIKGGLVICVAFDKEGKYSLYEIIVFFLLQTFQAFYRLLFAPNYLKEIDIFVKTKDFSICLLLFVGIICKAVHDTDGYDLIYFLVFLPIVTIGWMQFETYRKQVILLKIKNRSLKLEIEYEFALYVMMTLVRDTTNEKMTNQLIFGQLMDLVLTHIEDCDDQLCICEEMENFYELLRLKTLNNQDVFPLLRNERKKYKKIIDDQGLIGTISNLTDLTLKVNTSESTLLKTNNDQDRQDKQDENDEKQIEFELKNSKDSHKQEKKKSEIPEEEEKKKIKARHIYKINIDETKHRFLSELLYLFYFEFKSKFPNSFKIQLLCNYFSLTYKKKEMLCIYQMRSFISGKLSKIDQCCHFINEQYLLYEIHKVQKIQMYQTQNFQEGNFNGEYFIKMNQLYKDFNISIESLSASVSNFWKIFEKPSLNVEETQSMGTVIAQNIRNVFTIFSDLDSIKLFKDYQMYFQFAIIQLHILNDPVAYELYIGKMKSILEINKIYQKNFSSDKNTDYSNFIIVDANGQRFGQILQMNVSFRQMVGFTEENVKNTRIETFMPSLIRDKHPEFMSRYNKTGQSYIINNKVTMFIRKANGYVIPVELYIKFHYSIDYKYTFLAIIRPFYELAPFQNQVKYNLNQLLFLIADNDEGRISEYSESSKKLLNFGNYLQTDGVVKNISEFILDFNYDDFKISRQQRYIINEIYEQQHRIDLNYFKDAQQEQYYKISNQNNSGNEDSLYTYAKIRVFEERYSGGVLDMNIFCLLILSDQEKSQMTLSSFPSKQEEKLFHKQILLEDVIEIKDKEDDLIIKGEEQSQSATGSSYNSSTTSMTDFRNFHSFTEQNTPKSLRIIIQMIVALYIIMMIIASVNLGINLTRQLQSKEDVHTVRQAFDRMNWLSMNQLLTRVITNKANGYEPDETTLTSNGFQDFQQLLSERIEMLKSSQQLLQKSKFTLSKEFYDFQNDKNIPLYYINEQNQYYTKYESLEIGINLYLSKLTEINSMTKQEVKGNLDIQTLTPRVDSKYKPTIDEQTLFFVLENGNKELRKNVITVSNMYARESELHAEQNINQTKITAIISICTIVIIGLIIAPVLTKAEIRKYKGLLYFLKIPKVKFAEMIKNSEYCLNMNDETRYLQIQKDYESFLGVKIANQQVEQLRQLREEKQNINNQESREITQEANTLSIMNTHSYDNSSTVKSKSTNQMSVKSLIKQKEPQSQKNSLQKNSSDNGKHLQTIQQEEQENDNDEEYEQVNNFTGAVLDADVNNNKFNLDTLNLKQNRQQKRKQSVDSDNDNNKTDNEKYLEKQEEEQEQNEVDNKYKLIISRANKRRSTMIFSSLSIIMVLSTYFIIAYFMAMNTFQTASSVIGSLEIIFYKGSCFDSAMNFLRENQIRNESIYLQKGDTMNAADYYIDFCFKKEVDYNNLRKNLPLYFNGASDFIEQMESKQFCDYIYSGDHKLLKQQCKESINGILNEGLTNAFYYMFTQILKANLRFNSLGSSRQRTVLALETEIKDPLIIEIIDVKAKVLDPALNQLKQICMDSVITYIQDLLNDFIVAFVVFASLLTFSVIILVFLGFKILRRSMWDTNIILKIIPFETLPKSDRVQIKDFFNS